MDRVVTKRGNHDGKTQCTIELKLHISEFDIMQTIRDFKGLGLVLGNDTIQQDMGRDKCVGARYKMHWKYDGDYHGAATSAKWTMTQHVRIAEVEMDKVVYHVKNSTTFRYMKHPIRELEKQGIVVARVIPSDEYGFTKLILTFDPAVPLGFKVRPFLAHVCCFSSGKWRYIEYMDDQSYAKKLLKLFDDIERYQPVAEEVDFSQEDAYSGVIMTAEVVHLEKT